MFYSDNPVLDFAKKDAEEEKWLRKRPICAYCNKPIQDERLWDFDGELYHDECAKNQFRKWTEDYME